MRKIHLWAATGLLGVFGTWQLAAKAQQPSSSPDIADVQIDLENQLFTFQGRNQEDVAKQIDALNGLIEKLKKTDSKHESNDKLAEELTQASEQLQSTLEKLKTLIPQETKIATEEMRKVAEEKAKQHAAMAKDHAADVRLRAVKQFEEPRHLVEHLRELLFDSLIAAIPVERSPEDAQQLKKFRKLVSEYRESKDDNRKQELRNTIREMLQSQIDRDLDQRKQKLAQMEQRVQQLRSQLDASDSRKPEMINSLLHMLDDDSPKPFGLSPEWLDALSFDKLNRTSMGINYGFDVVPRFANELIIGSTAPVAPIAPNPPAVPAPTTLELPPLPE